jgi:drug/metabolite transporter (DMT)-like permease
LINLGWLSLVNLLWASQFPAYKLAADSMSVSALSLYTFLFAILILIPFLVRERRRGGPAKAAMEGKSRASGAASYVLLGVLGLLPPSILMSWGIEHSSGSNAAILTLTIPILMLAIAVPMLGERFTWVRIGALLLALVGAIFISGNDVAGRILYPEHAHREPGDFCGMRGECLLQHLLEKVASDAQRA